MDDHDCGPSCPFYEPDRKLAGPDRYEYADPRTDAQVADEALASSAAGREAYNVEPHYRDLTTGTEEVRVVDPDTGGEKGSKLARFDLIPADVLWALAEHYGRGALKYEDRNWERGYKWSLSYAALMRHLSAFWLGETIDDETGSPHIVAVVWHAVALAAFEMRAIGTDDRPV